MTQASDAARAYARANSERFVDELREMLRIPSLSGDPAHDRDVRRMAEWLQNHLKGLGVDRSEVMETAGHPVVYAEWMGAGSEKPTVLIYGHYDVVPAEMADGWHTDPFEPIVRDDVIYARGATDDKGQLLTHIKALESYLQAVGSAPVNVKVLLEGEEEISSPNLRPFLEEHLDMLRADVVVISDSSMRSIDEPAIMHSLRGMTYIEVEVHGPREDLHSGLWGGAAHNPAQALAEILARMFNPDHTIAVPGFYDDVVPLSDAERAMIAKTDLTEEQYVALTGVPAAWGDAAYSIRERIAARPTLDINGLWSGWSGQGPKTIVPAKAGCKLSCRLVGDQDPHKVFALLKSYIESIAPRTVHVEVRLVTTGRPALFSFDSPAMQAAARAYVTGWGAEPVFTRGGGSIPVVADMAELMGVPVVLMGFGLDDDGLHSPNERYSLEMLRRGIETSIVYLDELARL